jgi:hypothetical protein
MNEKTFLLFGCGASDVVRDAAYKAVCDLYEKKGFTARYFDFLRDVKPDALLYVSRSIFFDIYSIRKMNGKTVRNFKIAQK